MGRARCEYISICIVLNCMIRNGWGEARKLTLVND
jgi:hypothetical protein